MVKISQVFMSLIAFSRGRDRPGERPRDRESRHPPSGPDYHRRTPPLPHGPRRSPPPHGPPRAPHRFDERRRSLSPGGRREEGYRQGPPRDQGGYGIGREPMRGRGGYPAPFDNRSRPMEGRRRNSPPPRQYVERGRGASRGRGSRGEWSIITKVFLFVFISFLARNMFSIREKSQKFKIRSRTNQKRHLSRIFQAVSLSLV